MNNKRSLTVNSDQKSGQNYRHIRSETHEVGLKTPNKKSEVKKQVYPRLLESGSSTEGSRKWNHKWLSSKIIEVQVCPHPSGHIKEVNFRYEKGEPEKMPYNQYACFFCDVGAGEYVTSVRGGFKNGILRYLSIETNRGRKSNFCEC